MEDRVPLIDQPGNGESLAAALEASHVVLDTADILRDMKALQAKIAANADKIRSLCSDEAIDALLQIHDELGDAIPAVEDDLPMSWGPMEFRFPNNSKAV
jgi:hypothetical protein